jgi:ubiquinone biosynthesis protein Coq4
MALVFRKDTLTPLTYEQMDGNFEFLQTEITELQSGLGISPEYIRGLFYGGPGITYNSATGEIKFTGGSNVVTSINGQSGAVVLTAADLDITTSEISEGINQYYTPERAWDAIKDKINVAPGLSKTYNVSGMTIAPRNFNIALVGDIVGSARVTELNDIIIDTRLFGVTIDTENITVTEGVIVRSPPTVPGTRRFTGLDFDPEDFLVTDTGAYATIRSRQNNDAIVEIVGNAISGTVFGEITETESGIDVTFDRENGSIRVAPRDFKITLTGAVTGEGTVTRLRDVTINTINSQGYIKGIDAYSDVNKVNIEPLTEVQFDVNAFNINAINKRLFISTKNALTPQDVRDIIGNTVQGTEQDVDLSTITETGIIVTYDRANNTLSVAPRNFTITLDGAVSGSATISRLQDVTLTTFNVNEYISGLDVFSDVNQANTRKITELQFGLNAFDITTVGKRAFIDIKNSLTPQDVRDIIGNTVQGTEQDVDLSTITETGIIVTYDRANNTLSVAPRNFTITIDGAVSGSATISRLQDVTLTTNNINNYISGLDVYSDVNQVSTSKITQIQFDMDDFGVSAIDNRAYLRIKNALTPQDIRDIVGDTVTGTERDVDLSTLSETGIIVTYDRDNNTLSVAPRNFTITLDGAVSGSATITRLRDVTLTTNNINNYISGLDVYSDVNKVNENKITELSFDLNQFIVTANDNRTSISIGDILNPQDIRDIIGDTVSGTERDVDLSTLTETGIIVTYDRDNNTLSVAPRNFTITIDGAVSGSATITRLRDVTLTTNNINNYISGLDVYSDVNQVNVNKITEFSFNLDQFIVTADNNRTNISIGNILNPQDIRDIIGDTVTGTERDVDLSTLSETGIIVTYDRDNNTLSVAPRNFTITLDGAVGGSATISRLRDVTLTTTNINNYISGLDVYSDVNKVNVSKINEISFDLNQFIVTANDNRTNISIGNILNPQDIRDIIGDTVSGTERDVDLSTITETGIIVTYDRDNNTLSVAPRNFTITIDGAVSGSATISRLQDVTLTTNNINNYISGLDVYSDVNKVNVSKINEISFDLNQFAVTADNNRTNIALTGILDQQDIRDIIGDTITGTERDVDLSTITETGIIVTYDRDNNTLSVAPRNFTITIDGAVAGSATISRLRDVTLTTNNINNYISGLDVYSDVNKVNVAKVTEFGFDPAQFDIISANQRVLVGIKGALTSQDVRDIIGNTIQGTEQDLDLSTLTETGIIVTYDRDNNTLSVAPRNFTITLDGAVSGSATITRLQDVVLTTNNVNNYISGLDVYSDVNKVNENKITEISFNLDQFIVTANDNRTSISIGDILNPQDIRDIIGDTVSGTERDVDLSTITETGIIVTYDRDNNTLSVAPRNFTITIDGAVSGSATVSRLGDVTLTTNNINNYISGLDVYSDVNKVNIEKITNLKFNMDDFIVQASQNQATLSLKNILSPADVRDIIGNTIIGTEAGADLSSLTETGIIVSYNTDNQSLSIAPRNFTITLDGAVTGSATIRKLRDITLTTYNTNNYISGLDLYEGSNKTNVGKITELEFDQVNFDVNSTNERTVVTLKNQITQTDIRNIIGQTVTGTELGADLSSLTETGIIVNYSKANGTLSIAPRNFTINLTGAVTGSAIITRLSDTTINLVNSNNYISGLDIFDGVEKKNVTPIKSLVFDPAQFNITTDGITASVQFNNPIDTQAVRDIIGTTVLGESIDPVTGRTSETGILVSYEAENNFLSIAPQDFTISLIGDVSGTATISKLRSATIQTTTTAIKGLGISSNSVPFDSGVKNLNFSSNFTLTRDASTNTLAVDVSNLLNTNQVLSIVGGALTGSQNGIAVSYNSNERQFSYNLANLEVNLQGAISGAATLEYSGTGTQTLNIITEIGEIGSGLDVKDEGETKGTSVSAINFVGGGVTTAVSMDGSVATVSIPNSPAAEKFLLIDQGSANVPNARRLVAGTGIVLQDSGPGDDFIISASGGEVLGKVQVTYDGELVDEVPTVNFIDSQQVFFEVTSDGSTNKVNVTAYSLLNGWFRKAQINNGTLTDKYGNSLDMGPIIGGIIENQINLGDIA